MSPCPMCAGAAIWFNVKRIVIGENVTMTGQEELLQQSEIEVIVLDEADCKQLMIDYNAKYQT